MVLFWFVQNDSGSDDERNRIETELATLRSDLQRTLLSEEQLMVRKLTALILCTRKTKIWPDSKVVK